MDVLVTVMLVIVVALVFDFTNGFHDTANAMATSVATGALKPRTAVVIAGVQEGVWPNTRLRGGLLDTWRLVDAASRADGDSSGTLDRRRAAMHDELRLLARALSRATGLVLVTAVDDDDGRQP